MIEGHEPEEEVLPRRDRWLLPLVSLSVIFAFWGASDAAARLMFAERGKFTCSETDSAGLQRQKTNCVSSFKSAEGPEVEYRFNACGYRSANPCGTKPSGTLRVALIGTSVTMGLHVLNDETFAVRVEKALNRICRQPVEVQNMGAVSTLSSQPGFAAESLRLSPDVVVFTVMPFDLEGLGATAESNSAGAGLTRIKLAWDELLQKLRASKFAFAVAHFMLLNEQILYEAFLSSGGSRNVMSVPMTAAGEKSYAGFTAILDSIVAKLDGSGVPLVVMAVPNRVGAAMVSNHSRVEGTDAFLFGQRIGEIAVQHGALALDATPLFADSPHAERLFYPVDNHPAGGVHALIAQALLERLTDGSMPQMAACREPRPEDH